MQLVSAVLVISLIFSTSLALGADAVKSSAEHVKQLNGRILKSSVGKTGEYAKDLLENAHASINAARAAVSVGDEILAQQKLEAAELQLTLADAKAAEKELVEQVAVRRVELKRLETQLEKYRQGEGF